MKYIYFIAFLFGLMHIPTATASKDVVFFEYGEKQETLPTFRILVAEDSLVNQRMLCKLIKKVCMESQVPIHVTLTNDGCPALECFQNALDIIANRFHMVITDRQMLKMNGEILVSSVQALLEEKGIDYRPVFILQTSDKIAEVNDDILFSSTRPRATTEPSVDCKVNDDSLRKRSLPATLNLSRDDLGFVDGSIQSLFDFCVSKANYKDLKSWLMVAVEHYRARELEAPIRGE